MILATGSGATGPISLIFHADKVRMKQLERSFNMEMLSKEVREATLKKFEPEGL